MLFYRCFNQNRPRELLLALNSFSWERQDSQWHWSQLQSSNSIETRSGMWLKHAKQKGPPHPTTTTPSLQCLLNPFKKHAFSFGHYSNIFDSDSSGGLTVKVYQITHWQGLLIAKLCWFCSKTLIKSEEAPLRESLCHEKPDPRSGQPGSPRMIVTVKRWQGCWRRSGIKGEMKTTQRERWMTNKSEWKQNQVEGSPKLLVAGYLSIENWDSSWLKKVQPSFTRPKRTYPEKAGEHPWVSTKMKYPTSGEAICIPLKLFLHQACCCLRAFELALPSAWEAVAPGFTRLLPFLIQVITPSKRSS